MFSATSFADTIYFKNGRKLEGKIIEEDSYKVKIKIGKFSHVYYRDKISRIVKEGGKGSQLGVDYYSESMGVDGISDEERELVLRLLDANGSRESMILMFQQIISEAPEESQGELRELLKIDKIIEQLIPVYAKYYTAEEIKVLISFYKSPTGIKHIKLAPQNHEGEYDGSCRIF